MKRTALKGKWQHFFYTVSHPADGYYWIRHQEKGSLGIAFLMVILYGIAFSMNRISASFIVNDIEPRTVNLPAELAGVIALYFILCVGNWSVTCLMEGEGRFRDILTAAGYALFPMLVSTAAATAVSHLVAENEEAFYTILMGLGTAYTVVMLLTGIMQIHNYTFGKTLVTLFLTVIAMLIIIFLMLLVFNFITQVYSFFRGIYMELVFRV